MQISLKHVNHIYMPNTPFEQYALQDINLEIPAGGFTVIIGITGSGKSTLVQHLNGLLWPSSGEVKVGPYLLTPTKQKATLRKLRQEVGYLFQYPEHQLFEETVEKEIIFGPLNFGVPEAEAKGRARKLLPVVGLNPELLSVSPFQLSGGQMRRVAIASILAQDPKLLILDEPAAGLDPTGRQEMMQMLYEYHQEKKKTTVLITHHMEDALQYADYILVMSKGSVWKMGTPEEVYSNPRELGSIGLQLPETIRFAEKLKRVSGTTSIPLLKSRSELAAHLIQSIQAKKQGGV